MKVKEVWITHTKLCTALFTVQWCKKNTLTLHLAQYILLLNVPTWNISADMRCPFYCTNNIIYLTAGAHVQMSCLYIHYVRT